MRLDSLVRLIEAADFSSFREIATKYLESRGYRDVTLADGWADGGQDVRIFQSPGVQLKHAFQITVERNWKSKFTADAKKAKTKLSITRFTLLISRRIAETEIRTLSDSLLKTDGIEADRLDAQSVASHLAKHPELLRSCLEILGVPSQAIASTQPTFSQAASLAWSYVFFGVDVNNFREKIAESVVIDVLARGAPRARSSVVEEAASMLNVSAPPTAAVNSAVDRMLLRGELLRTDSGLSLKAELQVAVTSMRAIRDADWKGFVDLVRTTLQKYSTRKFTTEEVLPICGDLGALVADSSAATASHLSARDQANGPVERIRARVRSINAMMDSLRVAEGNGRHAAVAELTEVADKHPFGRFLFAGTLFDTLSAASTPELLTALGARSNLRLLLDASVALPMLCGLLYGAVESRFSQAATEANKSIRAHEFTCEIPKSYVEEIATHLIDAFRYYSEVADVDEDLRLSENAFVAHYVGLKRESRIREDFLTYLSTFGFTEGFRKKDYSDNDQFYTARSAMETEISRLLDSYGIRVRAIDGAPLAILRKLEEDVAYVLEAHNIKRPAVLVKHDIGVLSFLEAQGATIETSWALCTWDRLHFLVRNPKTAHWLAINPVALVDCLSAAAPANEEQPYFVSPHVLALTLMEEAARLGATIWDFLLAIDKDIAHDAARIRLAKQFKEDYLSKSRDSISIKAVEDEWNRWKTRHGSSSQK